MQSETTYTAEDENYPYKYTTDKHTVLEDRDGSGIIYLFDNDDTTPLKCSIMFTDMKLSKAPNERFDDTYIFYERGTECASIDVSGVSDELEEIFYDRFLLLE